MVDEYRPLSEQARMWVEAMLGPNARVRAVSGLPGGLTADVDRLTVSVGGGEVEVVLRRWSDQEWGTGLVRREAAGLQALAGHDLPVPCVLGSDASGEAAGEPCLLMTALSGKPFFNPSDVPGYAAELAATLARIHDIAPTGLARTDPHGFDVHRVHRWVGDRVLAEAVIDAAVDSSVRPFQPVLVHGDFQAFNMLWRDQRLSGVVDWAYVGSGRREVDVGLCRLSLAVLFSAGTAEHFLRQYEAEAGVRVDPCADLRALLAFEPSWLDFVSSRVTGAERAGERGMADQVEAVLRTAVERLA